MFIWIVYKFFDSFNGFYQFNKFEIQSGYMIFIVESFVWFNPIT